MVTIINKANDDYRTISTKHFFDKKLSWAAKGILSCLLAYRSNKEDIMIDLDIYSDEGFHELINIGYIIEAENELADQTLYILEIPVDSDPDND